MQNVPLLKKKEATIFLNIFLFQLLACQIKFQVKVAKIQGQSSTCSFATTEPNLCVLVVRLKVNPKAKALDQYTIKSQAVAHLGQQHPLKVQKFNSSTPWLVAHLPWYIRSLAPADFIGAVFTRAHFQKIAQISSLCNSYYISEGIPSCVFGY